MSATPQTIWGIHAGRTGDAHTLFLQRGVIAIGWKAMGDLSMIPATRDAFKAAYSKAHPNDKPAAIPNNAGQPFRFLHEMKKGDLVVYPSKVDRQINIGQITGDYVYDPKSDGDPNLRPVKWMKVVPRPTFSEGALHEVGSNLSLFQIKHHADEFLAVLGEEKEGVDEAVEGGMLIRLHRLRERNVEVVQTKKAQVFQANGRLRCEVCDFDFQEQFGDLGKDFIECHHKKALSTLLPGQKTKLSDLALVCSNCHRMLHRGKPWPSVDQLRAMIQKQPSATLDSFHRFLYELSAPHTARLRRAADNQVYFMQACHDRRMLERFEVTLSRYGIWAQELLDELQPLADDAPQGGAAAKTLSEVAEAIRLFVDIQHRFCFQNYLAEQ